MVNDVIGVAILILLCQVGAQECKNVKLNDDVLNEFIRDFKERYKDLPETQCVNTVLNLLNNVQNRTLWATWIWNSMSTEPMGYLSGSKYQLGHYEQCMNPPWLETHPEFRTQYCMAHAKPTTQYKHKRPEGPLSPYTSVKNYLHTPSDHMDDLVGTYWGLCLPASCDADFIKTFMVTLLQQNHLVDEFSEASIRIENCEIAGSKKPLGFLSILFIVLCTFLSVLAVISTYIYKKNVNTTGMAIARAFSLKENVDKLTKVYADELDVLNGIRFLSACLIIFLHQFYMATIFSPMLNPLKAIKTHADEMTWALAPLAVENFFVMSGLLSVKHLLEKKDNMEHPVRLVIKRYFRLAPVLGMVILFSVDAYNQLKSGPIWHRVIQSKTPCYKTWWLSLLMINNYIRSDDMCYLTSWTVPCDFQMTIFAIAMVCLYNKRRIAAIATFVLVFVSSISLIGIMTSIYDFDVNTPLKIRVEEDVITDEYFQKVYIKTHLRIGPYLIGMILGLIMSIYDPMKYKKTLSKSVSTAGALFALGVTYVISGLYRCYCYEKMTSGKALFAAVYRATYGGVFGLLVICLVYGTVPLLNDFFSWKVFRPLGRLSYSLYLCHIGFTSLQYYNSYTPYYMDHIQNVQEGFGTIAVSVMASFVYWCLVEAPANQLVNDWFKSRDRSKEIKIKSSTEAGSNKSKEDKRN